MDKDLDSTEWDYSPKNNLTHANTSITITCAFGDSSASSTVPITIKKIPMSLRVTTPPTKSNYVYQETFDKTGMEATITYSDGSTEVVGADSLTVPVTTFNIIGTQDINVTYSENGYTVDTKYTASIDKANPVITPSKTAFTTSAKALSDSMTIESSENGDLTASLAPGHPEGLVVEVDGRTVTVTADGNVNHSGKATVIVSTAETEHYKAGTKEIDCSVVYWEWGDETTAGDADWWEGLKAWCSSATSEERAACVGKKKKVTLSAAVAGWSSGANVSMICVDSDVDADNSLTFHTEGCSPTGAVFGSNALWASSTAKTSAENFANNCSATNSILEVTKLTCSLCNNSRTNAADVETTAKGWIPSEQEMGLNSYSPSAGECTKGRPAHMGYKQYNSNAARIKYSCAADGTISTTARVYWERSRYYSTSYSNRVCRVGYSGSASGNGYNDSCYLAPAFVIG